MERNVPDRSENAIPETTESQRHPPSHSQQLLLGIIFGFVFGFLLQKGGVAKYQVLMGMLLLEDFTVIKVMVSAIIVGTIGIHSLHSMGLVQLHIKPTRYAANIIGGLIFGVGFGLAGYCPGTTAAALGQGNFDSIAVMMGMMAGSYLYAERSGWLALRVESIGIRGEMTLPQLVQMRRSSFIPVFVLILVLALFLLEKV